MTGVHNVTAVAGGTTLSVVRASLTLDDTWSPYVQGDIVVVAPANLSILDPRTNSRVVLTWTLTQLGASTPAQTLTADLGIRSRRREQDGTIALTLQSDEAYLQDLLMWAAPVRSSNPSTVDSKSARLYITAAFQTDLPADQAAIAFALQPGSETGTFLADTEREWHQGQAWWDYLTGGLLQFKLRLWCDELRRFWLTVEEAPVAGTVTLSEGATVIEASEEIDRNSDVWADSVILEYRESLTAPYQVSVTLGPGTRSRTLHVKIDAATPWSNTTDPEVAAIPAKAILDRLQRRGRAVSVTAVADYAVRPGQSAFIDVLGTPRQSGQVQSVTWNYPDDTMTVTTRNLTDAP